MTEPKSRLAENGTPFQRALVRSAAGDAPPADGKAKLVAGLVASGVAVGASTAGAAGVAKVAVAGGMSSFAKWIIFLGAFSGLVGGAVLTAEMLGDRSTAQPTATSVIPERTPEEQVLEESDPAIPTTSRKLAKPVPLTVTGAPVNARSPSSEKPIAVPPTVPAIDSPATTLAEQVKILDNARAALRAGNADRALSLVASYRDRFPKGELHPEARAVENEARRMKNQPKSTDGSR